MLVKAWFGTCRVFPANPRFGSRKIAGEAGEDAWQTHLSNSKSVILMRQVCWRVNVRYSCMLLQFTRPGTARSVFEAVDHAALRQGPAVRSGGCDDDKNAPNCISSRQPPTMLFSLPRGTGDRARGRMGSPWAAAIDRAAQAETKESARAWMAAPVAGYACSPLATGRQIVGGRWWWWWCR